MEEKGEKPRAIKTREKKTTGRKKLEKSVAEEDHISDAVPLKKASQRIPRTRRSEMAKTPQEDKHTGEKTENCDIQAPKKKTRKKSIRKKKTGKKLQSEEEDECISERFPKSLQPSGDPKKYVGAHLSIQGGIWRAVQDAKRIGAKAIGLFLGSQRTWNSKALDEKAAEKFRKTCIELGFESRYILPHSPYLMNLGSPKPDVFQKSRDMLVEELRRCQKLGLTLYNIHPGAHLGAMPISECLERIADGINHAHSQVPGVTVVLENMSCQGSTVGGRFEELRGIIDHVTDKSRIGVCLDTCHAFAAGHNLSQEAGLQHMLDEFSTVVGIPYLKAIHLNDSKGKVGCRLDRHENIGQGHIGVEGFRQVMNEPRFNGIPMILETPYSPDNEDYSKEINLLYSLCAVDGAAGSDKLKL
ncbi:putative endonuclease 4 isoform 1-T1 [Rhinophrynus dorsalis]